MLVGVLLFVLGAGNWLVSRNKLAEYTHRLVSEDPAVQAVGTLGEFPNLTERTNATVLERLHRASGDYTFTTAKIDFYSVVQNGGRFFSVAGVILISVALVQSRRDRERRSAGRVSRIL